jgi:hypothetical protein
MTSHNKASHDGRKQKRNQGGTGINARPFEARQGERRLVSPGDSRIRFKFAECEPFVRKVLSRSSASGIVSLSTGVKYE